MYYLTVDQAALSPKADVVETSVPARISLRKIFLFLGIGIISIFFFVFACVLVIFQNARSLSTSVTETFAQAGAGNIQLARQEIAKSERSINFLNKSFSLISWTKAIPFVGSYSRDLEGIIKASAAGVRVSKVILTSVEPSMGLLALESTDPEEIYSQRTNFLASSLPVLSSNLDGELGEIETIEKGISQVNPSRYPNKYKGKIDSLLASFGFFVDAVKSIKALPFLLGIDSPKQYLILFQNDKEIRPTGGFMTAYSIMRVENGKFSPVASEDIYSLDAKYKPTVPAPEPLIKYIKGPYVLSQNLRLRDMNWSPDFGSSMINFRTAAREAGVSDIDGIIAIDTHALVNVMEVLGDVGVPGFGTYNTDINPECKCPQVIHELESFADVEGPIVWDPVSGEIVYKPENADNRKKIIGPLMNSIIASTLSLPKEKFPLLVSATIKSFSEKHVLFYIFNEDIQKVVSDIDLDGRIKQYDGDYLHISDANLGGRKSNLYVTQEVSQEIEIGKGGEVVKTITLTYKNPEKHDGWLNSVLPNWVRMYVPKGSELIISEGLEEKIDPYEDLGKTVFAGFFQLRPEGVSKVTFKYKLPMAMQGEYRLLIQKQPGTASPLYTIILGNYEKEILLNKDKEIKIAI
jgi:hypothetical protein